MSNRIKQLARSARAAQDAQILSVREVEQLGDEPWVTLVLDNAQPIGRPVLDGNSHRILCHEDDLLGLEQMALQRGYRVRVEGELLDQIGREQPYDVAMGYHGGAN